MSDIKMTRLQDFFGETFSEEFLREADVEYALAEIAGRAHEAKKASGLSYRDIASRMGLNGPAVVQRIVADAEPHNVTVATLVRFSHACGCRLKVEFEPRKAVERWASAWSGAGAAPSAPTAVVGLFAMAHSARQPREECARPVSFEHTPARTALVHVVDAAHSWVDFPS